MLNKRPAKSNTFLGVFAQILVTSDEPESASLSLRSLFKSSRYGGMTVPFPDPLLFAGACFQMRAGARISIDFYYLFGMPILPSPIGSCAGESHRPPMLEAAACPVGALLPVPPSEASPRRQAQTPAQSADSSLLVTNSERGGASCFNAAPRNPPLCPSFVFCREKHFFGEVLSAS